MWSERLLAHSIDVWRADLSAVEPRLPGYAPALAAELEFAEEGDAAMVELCRQFPSLPRAIAEYLAR